MKVGKEKRKTHEICSQNDTVYNHEIACIIGYVVCWGVPLVHTNLRVWLNFVKLYVV